MACNSKGDCVECDTTGDCPECGASGICQKFEGEGECQDGGRVVRSAMKQYLRRYISEKNQSFRNNTQLYPYDSAISRNGLRSVS